MGWERRGNHEYYYRKERDGSRVKSIYVGRSEIAQMVSQIQQSSPLLKRLQRGIKSSELVKLERAEVILNQATALTNLVTQAALLAAGFHTHHRQWRRMRARKT